MAAVVSLWYCEKEGINFLRLADLAMPTVSLGQALGRLGCFSAGCCWGAVTTKAKAPFAVNFPGMNAMNIFGGMGGTPSLAYSSMTELTADQGGRYVVEATGAVTPGPVEGSVQIAQWVTAHGHTLPVHPTQLYESLGQLCLLVALLTLRQYRRFHGQIFAYWLIAYAMLRTTVEVFRGDNERGTLHAAAEYFNLEGLARSVPLGVWYNFSISQFISLCAFSLGVYLLAKNLRGINERTPDLKPAVV
jgi:phosphatidylglycerol:prolipoprotein diacylglycerol transferase